MGIPIANRTPLVNRHGGPPVDATAPEPPWRTPVTVTERMQGGAGAPGPPPRAARASGGASVRALFDDVAPPRPTPPRPTTWPYALKTKVEPMR